MMNSMLTDSLFGSSQSAGTGSFFSASNFGDLAMMKSGVYTKMLRSYISQVSEDSDSETSSKTNSDTAFRNMVSEKMEGMRKKETTPVDEGAKALSGVKGAAKKLETAAQELSGMDFDNSSREDLYKAAKQFVSSYNSVVTSASKTDDASIGQSVQWMKESMKSNEKQLEKIGITVGKDGALALDEKKFMAANLSDIQGQMGSCSVVSGAAQRATGLVNLAANQISFKSGSSLYSSNGVYK